MFIPLQDYVDLPSDLIKKSLAKVGIELKEKTWRIWHKWCWKSVPVPKSVGNGTTTIVDITKECVLATISFLTEKIAKRLREKNFWLWV